MKIAKQGIEELGAEKFAESTLLHNIEQNKATKKSLDGSFEGISHSVICMKWWERVVGTRTFNVREVVDMKPFLESILRDENN